MRRFDWSASNTSRQINNPVLTKSSAVDSLPPGALIYSLRRAVNKTQYFSERETRFWIALSRSQRVCCPFRGNLQLKGLFDGGLWSMDLSRDSAPWQNTKVARRALGGRQSPEMISYSHKMYPHWWSVLRVSRRWLASHAMSRGLANWLVRALQ